MKKLILVGLSVAALSFGGRTAWAEANEVTVKGEAQCAKCSLHKADKCASAIVAKENGQDVTYYLVENATTKKDLPHSEICTDIKKVKAKGTVKVVDGKKELTVSSISVVK